MEPSKRGVGDVEAALKDQVGACRVVWVVYIYSVTMWYMYRYGKNALITTPAILDDT